MQRTSLYIILICGALGGGIWWLTRGDNSSGSSGAVDFNRDVRPILSDKCFQCHGPDANKREADLRLDIEEGAYKALKDDPSHHVIVPGKPEASELMRRLTTHDTSEVMPPPSTKLSLTAAEIEVLRRWIAEGAKYAPHWAFVPPQPQSLPKVRQTDWPKNDIDFFTLAAMERRGLAPNDEADRERLLRRLSFDVTGLPPSVGLQDSFLNDTRPDAYERMIDRLLAKPQYGEKMAVAWLDVARYADSHGYQDDGLRTMWPWRDWVIHAFNANYPYDKFVTWQLAGDLMPNPTKEMLLATGFNRNHKITQEGGVIDEEYRVEYVTDRTNTFGKAFLGLTMECARCHDHKYDPIAQREYYGTFAFFNQMQERGFNGDIQAASLADPPKMRITTEDIQKILTFIHKPDTTAVEVMIMKDTNRTRPTYLLARGQYDQHGPEVSFGTPSAVFAFDTTRYAKNRLGLVQHLFDPRHPLTARVYVNRVWQEIFGRGLVKTVGDFGMQGDQPSHPELLDWLALDFVKHGWDIKRLVKQMLLSATYRQSANVSDDKLAADPDNIYLARGPRSRLAAEMMRDHILAASGLLVPQIGGPSVKPYQPKGLWEAASSGRGQLQNFIQDHGDSLYRRGIYTFIKRTVPSPVMLTFDASSRDQCEVRRLSTNTPLQSLVLLNDPQVLEAARVMAQKLLAELPDDASRLDAAFRRIISRRPRSKETATLAAYLRDEQKRFGSNAKAAAAFIRVGEHPLPPDAAPAPLAALMQVVHTIMNMEDAVTK